MLIQNLGSLIKFKRFAGAIKWQNPGLQNSSSIQIHSVWYLVNSSSEENNLCHICIYTHQKNEWKYTWCHGYFSYFSLIWILTSRKANIFEYYTLIKMDNL